MRRAVFPFLAAQNAAFLQDCALFALADFARFCAVLMLLNVISRFFAAYFFRFAPFCRLWRALSFPLSAGLCGDCTLIARERVFLRFSGTLGDFRAGPKKNPADAQAAIACFLIENDRKNADPS